MPRLCMAIDVAHQQSHRLFWRPPTALHYALVEWTHVWWRALPVIKVAAPVIGYPKVLFGAGSNTECSRLSVRHLVCAHNQWMDEWMDK